MSTKVIVAAAYCRTSKEFKNVERISIKQQVDDALRLATDHNYAMPERHIYIDEDTTSRIPPRHFADGQKQERPGLTRLMDAIERGEVNTVICRKRDRLFRKTEWALRFYSFLKRHNCGLLATNENLPTGTDASGMFALTVLSAAAELELEKTRENVKAAKAYARRQGWKMCPVWTPGYKDGTEKRTVAVNEPVAAVVREIYQRCAGGESVMQITRWLNTDHANLARRRSPEDDRPPHWHAGSVWRILSNPFYVGLTRDGSKKSDLYPPIVDAGVFWKVQELFKSRTGTRIRKNKQRFLMTSLLICGYCRNNMQVCTCAGKDKHLRLFGCAHTEIPHERRPFLMREDRWIEFIRVFFDRERFVQVHRQNPEEPMLRVQLSKCDENLELLATMLAKNKLSTDAYGKAVEKLEDARKQVQERIAALPATNAYVPVDWAAMNDDAHRQHLRKIIKFIDVFDDHCVCRLHKYAVPVAFPLMKQAEPGRGVRPGSCLMPNGFTPDAANDILSGIDERLLSHADRPAPDEWPAEDVTADWTGWISGTFFPATEAVQRLASRRARARHGLKPFSAAEERQRSSHLRAA